jgi:hypothetical protein
MTKTKTMKKEAPKKAKTTNNSEKYTEVAVIVDRSGSMSSIATDAWGGFNAFLKVQKEARGKASFPHVQFDNNYEVLCDGVDIKDAKPYTEQTYQPRGSTALLDAVGKTINTIHDRITILPAEERPRVLVAIITDGHENASHEFKKEQIQTLVKNKGNEGWEFIYIAAGLDQFDAENQSSMMGISSLNTMSAPHTRKGMASSYNSMNEATLSYRAGSGLGNWRNK